MKKLTWKQERIIRFLDGRDWTGPTEIGLEEFHYDYCSASSRISPTCKTLVKKGVLERSVHGKYRLILHPPERTKGE